MALAVSFSAWLFVHALRTAHHEFARLKMPAWSRPALGGLMLGVVATLWIMFVNPRLNLANHGAGLLGSGYGAAQGAITGAAWIPRGWSGVRILAALGIAKMLATSLTIGSGGSGGDFGPSIAIGGLLGGAFGRAAQLLVNPAIDPGAFALVGMGTFYGGIAHAPVSSAVMVCEMAGSYDLLVPLMLCEGIAFVALRTTSLYDSQRISRFDSPAHAEDATLDVLKALRVADTVMRDRRFEVAQPHDRVSEILKTMLAAAPWQEVFPVLATDGKLVGLLSGDSMRTLVREEELARVAVAADLMSAPATIPADDDLHTAIEKLLESGMRQLPVIDAEGGILGFLDESDIARAYHNDIARRRGVRDGDNA
jgi:CIC family chloride channel protein